MPNTIIDNLDVLVKDNIRIIKLPSRKFETPIAIIFAGPPFSEISSVVDYLAKRFPLAALSESFMADFLAHRATFFKRGTDKIFLLASKTIEELTKQKICSIYDASIKKHKDRETVRNLVQNAGGKIVLVYLQLSREEIIERLKRKNSQIVGGSERGFIMNQELINYELNSIEAPTNEEEPIVCNMKNQYEVEKIESVLQSYFLSNKSV